MPEPSVRAVVYEDRPGQLIGVRLLVASARRHSPGVHLDVVGPGAPAEFTAWVDRQPNASMREVDTGGTSGWDVKPGVLLAMLDAGVSPVVWLDSDLLVGRDVTGLLRQAPGALLTTEDWWYARGQASPVRTTGWGLQVGRVLARPVNTAVLRVDGRHRELLEAWREIVADPRYRTAQALPHADRPLHAVGDQEALGALLGSERFASVELAFLRRGRDIAQCLDAAGFSPAERVRVRVSHRVSAIVHAMGRKPWCADADGRLPAGSALSPYVALAAGYSGVVDEPMPWAAPRGLGVRVADGLTRGDPVLRQLGPAVAQSAVWQARRVAGRVRHRGRSAV